MGESGKDALRVGFDGSLKLEFHGFTAALAEDLPDVLARVDLVCQSEGAVVLVDFKTSRSSWNAAKSTESAEQLQIYRHAMREMLAPLGLPIYLAFAVLTKHKKPRAELVGVPNGAGGDHAGRTIDAIRHVWSAVQAGSFHPVPGPMDCSTCAYRSKCPAYA